MNSCATYRAALVTVSNATAEFADAMERCSTCVDYRSSSLLLTDELKPKTRLKGPSYEAGTRLQAGSGLHHLIGNHMHVLVCRIHTGTHVLYFANCSLG